MEFAVLVNSHLQVRQVVVPRIHLVLAQHIDTTGGIVRHRVLDLDLPVVDTGVDDLETGHDGFRGVQYILLGDTRAHQVFLQAESYFPFRLGLDQVARYGDISGVLTYHGVGEEPEVGLEYAEHLLHRLAGNTDFLADDFFAVQFHPLVHHAQGDMVCILDSDIRFPVR